MMKRWKLLPLLLVGLLGPAGVLYASEERIGMDDDMDMSEDSRMSESLDMDDDLPSMEEAQRREALPPTQAPDVSASRVDGKPSAAFALRVGPYRPDDLMPPGSPVDYEAVFGDNPAALFNLDWEWQAVRVPYLGTLAIGASIGYGRKRGQALSETGGELTASSERETLTVVPASVDVTYRMNLFQNQPLVPYAGAGVDYWYFSDSTEVGDRSTSGAKRGWHWRAGGQLLLDVFEQGAAGNLRRTWGIDNSYLFGEYRISRVSNFGDPGFDLSDRTWFAGLMIEY